MKLLRAWLLTFLIAALSLARVAGAAPSSPGSDAINLIAGDESWVEAYGSMPPPDAPEDARIATHLAWVEARLRPTPTLELSPEQWAARARSLDHLHAYREAAVFPRWHGAVSGRRPRWVDDEGRYCAVAALVHASGDDALVAEVLRAHEADFVTDMRVPALAVWARDHEFSVAELALIQPSYDDRPSVNRPSRGEEQQAREEAERRARVPRPLVLGHVRAVIDRFEAAYMTRVCAGKQTGHWKIELDLRVREQFAVDATAIVTRVADRVREPALESCAAGHLRKAMESFIASANHTSGGDLRAHRASVPVDVATVAEIQAGFMALRREAEKKWKPLAACEAIAPELLPARVPIRVSGWRGEVWLRWDDMPKTPMEGMNDRERDFWYCLQSSLMYGDVQPVGPLDGTAFDVEVARGGVVTIAQGRMSRPSPPPHR